MAELVAVTSWDLWRHWCRERCAESSDPPCFELLESGEKFNPCDMCAHLASETLRLLAEQKANLQ
jgi:hypothetical protein